MKAATVTQLKKELINCSSNELLEICVRLSKFKKENKELLTYLLFEASNEEEYIENIKNQIDDQFKAINTQTFYYIKKSIRKILRETKKYIRYSQQKETEVELLLYFCTQLKHLTPSIQNNTMLLNLYYRQIDLIKKRIAVLHEDLQYDYHQELTILEK